MEPYDIRLPSALVRWLREVYPVSVPSGNGLLSDELPQTILDIPHGPRSLGENRIDCVYLTNAPKKGNSPMASRAQRETELKSLHNSVAGRNELIVLLRQYMNIPTGQIPVGTPYVQTILNHEFAKQQPEVAA